MADSVTPASEPNAKPDPKSELKGDTVDPVTSGGSQALAGATADPMKGDAPDVSVPVPHAPDFDGKAGDGDELLAAAQVKAPHVTREFLAQYGLDDDYLRRLASGEVTPPPYIGPEPSVDLHLLGGAWQITPKGVAPEDIGKGKGR